MAAKLSSPSPVINWIGAELALGIPKVVGHHLVGRLNVEADWLSRPHDRPVKIPDKLKKLKIHKFDGAARRTSDLPPPGVAPCLWGLESTVLQALNNSDGRCR